MKDSIEEKADRLNKAVLYLISKQIITAKSTQKDIASKMGLKVTTNINYALKGNEKYLTDTFLGRFNKAFNNIFFLDWLIKGEGEMLNETKPKIELEPIPQEDVRGEFFLENSHGLKFYDLGNGKYRMTVKLVPFCAYGRFANEADVLEPDKEEWEDESFEVSQIAHGNYLAFEVKGDSMDDGTRKSFEAGDRVLVRELNKIYWTDKLRYRDYPYWVVVFDSSVLIKQIINQDIEKGIITFHSLNPSPEYCDFTLCIDDIRKLYYVVQKKPKIVHYKY